MADFGQEDFYERRDVGDAPVPEAVKSFASKLCDGLRDNSTNDLHTMYEDDYNHISESYFKASAWPHVSQVAPEVDDDENFIVLYKELYFRHIYAKLEASMQDRVESFANYIDLFNIILGLNTAKPEIELPTMWLWDLIDEFVYQFESFHDFVARGDFQDEDLDVLKQNPHVWSVQTVVRYLHAMVNAAKIDIQRCVRLNRPHTHEEKSDISNFTEVTGFYALVGLCRVNCLIGDFATAVESAAPIDLAQQDHVVYRHMATHCTLFYNLGLGYFMSRRFRDSQNTLASFLSYYTKNQSRIPRTYQESVIERLVGKMYGLVAICSAIVPQRLDVAVDGSLKDRFGPQLGDLDKFDAETAKKVFLSCTPKFVALEPKATEEKGATPATDRHVVWLLQEMESRAKLLEVSSYLRMCTAVSTPKLASFLNQDEDAALMSLLGMKHRTRNLQWSPSSGAATAGNFTFQADVNFYLNKDVVHVHQHEQPQNYADFFYQGILKLEDIIHDVSSIGAKK